MARSLASFKSAGRGQLRPAQAPTSPRTTSEKSWRSANLSANCSTTSRENDPSAPRNCHPTHNLHAPALLRAGIALTLQYLLVTFPQRENFSRAHYSRRHGKPAPWRSLLRKSSSPKASVNIVKGSRVSRDRKSVV